MEHLSKQLIAQGQTINAMIEAGRKAAAEACNAGNQELAAHLDDALSGLYSARAAGRRAGGLLGVARFGDK